MEDKTLIERCLDHDFSMKIHGIEYCRLNMSSTRRIDCDYLSQEKDHNGLFPCILTAYFNTEGVKYSERKKEMSTIRK